MLEMQLQSQKVRYQEVQSQDNLLKEKLSLKDEKINLQKREIELRDQKLEMSKGNKSSQETMEIDTLTKYNDQLNAEKKIKEEEMTTMKARLKLAIGELKRYRQMMEEKDREL